MKTRQQQQIDKILGESSGEEHDHSLREQAMQRAQENATPTTMTPWEWQEWYARHGVPESHLQKEAVDKPEQGIIARTLQRLGLKSAG